MQLLRAYPALAGGQLAAMRVEIERIRVRRHEAVQQKIILNHGLGRHAYE